MGTDSGYTQAPVPVTNRELIISTHFFEIKLANLKNISYLCPVN